MSCVFHACVRSIAHAPLLPARQPIVTPNRPLCAVVLRRLRNPLLPFFPHRYNGTELSISGVQQTVGSVNLTDGDWHMATLTTIPTLANGTTVRASGGTRLGQGQGRAARRAGGDRGGLLPRSGAAG